MRFSHFFIDRPIFAAAVSVVITLIGLISYLTLPVDQYPQIAPPTVSVNALYPGATAEEIADTVAAPLEQQINGIADMLYMSSVVDERGAHLDHGDVQERHEHRHRAGRRAEPHPVGAAAAAADGARPRASRCARARRTSC